MTIYLRPLRKAAQRSHGAGFPLVDISSDGRDLSTNKVGTRQFGVMVSLIHNLALRDAVKLDRTF